MKAIGTILWSSYKSDGTMGQSVEVRVSVGHTTTPEIFAIVTSIGIQVNGSRDGDGTGAVNLWGRFADFWVNFLNAYSAN